MEASFIVPILLFFVLFVMPGEKNPKDSYYHPNYRPAPTKTYTKKAPIKSTKTSAKKVYIPTGEVVDDLDYKTIYKYIRSTYKKVPPEDAHLIAKHLVELGKEHQLDPKFVAAVMAKESGFNKKAISSTGAKGLGQIKDFNYKSLKIKDPYDIKQNTSGTVKYLKRMLGKWKGKKDKTQLALASYYQGYGTVSKADGNYNRDAQGYVNGIMKYYDSIKKVRKDYEK